MDMILQVQNLTKSYQSGERTLTVLNDISLEISAGSTTAIVGPSGSGKTTLIGLCAGLDQPTSGSIKLHGVLLEELSEDERAKMRNQFVGFIFQNFQLIPTLSAIENVMVPLELRGENHVYDQAADLLNQVELGDRLNHYPVQLSGGEQQRVAIARAFINRPKILFADEPTGNLDTETSENISNLMFHLNQEIGTTLVLVTHNLELAKRAQRNIHLKGGSLASDEIIQEQTTHF
ncbi:ABC transporter ATP-binding protein [candidate division KSB1 bacterium]|nr:ABC transporter ATP-binding protein [candidate division KSB1 bacterium]